VSLSAAGRYTRIGIGPAGPSLARLLNISICCQLKRDSFHYLQQDGVDGRLLLSD
jgi:hypothetical protein